MSTSAKSTTGNGRSTRKRQNATTAVVQTMASIPAAGKERITAIPGIPEDIRMILEIVTPEDVDLLRNIARYIHDDPASGCDCERCARVTENALTMATVLESVARG